MLPSQVNSDTSEQESDAAVSTDWILSMNDRQSPPPTENAHEHGLIRSCCWADSYDFNRLEQSFL